MDTPSRDPGDEPTLARVPVSDTVMDTSHDDGGPLDTSALRTLAFAERYATRVALGQGGMGEVVAVRDEQIGREIALKRLHHAKRDHAGVRARFVREARVQAQLEHPAIVPVYDLGVDEAGDAWFTMKKVRGATFAEVIAGLRAGDAEITARYARRRLLTAFSSVCLAIDFAHSRGIVHRDLKPENIMLGDFGEVYVLDWGIAKIAGLSDEELAIAETARPGAAPAATPTTELGEVLGTPGYMAPEQLLGHGVGPASDVWALGAILFELLALEPLLRRSTVVEAVAAADQPVDARPSVRAPDRMIPPALDAICRRATARDPGGRFESARSLHDHLEHHLDGDRELQRRRDQAAVHLARVHEAQRHAARGGADALEQRTLAMQEVNRALALDPTSEYATHAMVRLLAEPPPQVPEAARAELEASRHDEVRLAFRVGALGFLSMYLFLPLYVWMGIRDWPAVAAVLVLIAISAAALGWGARSPRHGRVAIGIAIVAAGVLIALLTRVVGPFASAPMLAFGMAVGLAFNPVGVGLRGLLAFVAIALVAPIALELGGAVDPSYVFGEGVIRIVPHMTELPAVPTAVTLTMTSVVTIGLIGLYLTRLHALLRAAQERIWIYSWNLRQFLPSTLPGALDDRRSDERPDR